MGTDRVILAEGCIYSTDCEETQINNNVLVVGGSGSGKTMSITEPRLLETKNSSLIVTLSKRRLVKQYRPLFLKRGYNVWDLDFINPANSNISYDPLSYVRNFADIVFLAESIVMADPKKKESNADPYWNEASISLLSAEIAYVLMVKKAPTFLDVLEVHDHMDIEEGNNGMQTTMDAKFQQIAEKDPSNFAVSCWRSFSKLPSRTMRCVFGTLNVMLDTIFTPELRKMIGTKPCVDLSQLSHERTVLFISTSAVNPALHCFVNMFYAQAFKQLFEIAEQQPDAALPIPVHVIADDFAVGSRILNFPQYISIFREKKISVTLLLQSESQLESMYGATDSVTIINNCDSYVYLGGMNLKTAKNISERLNAALEDVLYAPIGEVVLIRRGQKPIITQRYNILQNELYQEMAKKQSERGKGEER